MGIPDNYKLGGVGALCRYAVYHNFRDLERATWSSETPGLQSGFRRISRSTFGTRSADERVFDRAKVVDLRRQGLSPRNFAASSSPMNAVIRIPGRARGRDLC